METSDHRGSPKQLSRSVVCSCLMFGITLLGQPINWENGSQHRNGDGLLQTAPHTGRHSCQFDMMCCRYFRFRFCFCLNRIPWFLEHFLFSKNTLAVIAHETYLVEMNFSVIVKGCCLLFVGGVKCASELVQFSRFGNV